MMWRELRAERTRILLVEDNPIDARVALQALDGLTRPHEVEHVTDGSEALPALDRATAAGRTHDLILLDLNLPGRDGTEVSSIIKDDEDLMSIPVIIFSNSNAKNDVRSAYQSRANAYLVKPMEYTDIRDAMAVLLDFWLHWAHLPTTTSASQHV